MFRNKASQKLMVFCFDSATGLPKTGDASNITAYVSKDYGTVTVLGDTSATEMDSTNAKGYYLFDLTQAETDADTLLFTAKSSTSGIVVIGCPATVFTYPNTGFLAPATAGRTLVVDSSGLADANAVKVGPSGSGTAQTARDLGASVLISSGTGAGQLDFTSGVVKANVTQLLGTAWLTPAVAGTPDVNAKQLNGQTASLNANNLLKVSLNDILATTLTETSGQLAGGFKKFFNVGTPTGTLNDLPGVNPGASGGLFIAGTNDHCTITGAFLVSGGATYTSASGDGFVCSSTGGNGNGLNASGHGTGNGYLGTGGAGANGDGMHLIAGGGNAINYIGTVLFSNDFVIGTNMTVAGSFVVMTGTTFTHPAGDGLTCSSTGGNGNGLTLAHNGTGKDFNATTTPLVLAKTTNLTGLNDIAATAIVSGGAITTSSGAVSTVTTVTNQLTAAAIATGVWTDTTAGDFTVSASIGKSVMNGVSLGTGLTINGYTGNTVQTGDAFAYLGTNLGALGANATALASATNLAEANADLDELITTIGAAGAGLTATVTAVWATAIPGSFTSGEAGYVLGNIATGTPPTAAAIATAVWQDTTSGDFTVSGSPGFLLTGVGTSGVKFTTTALANAGGGGGPTAAQIATAVWEDLTAGGDFGTAGSIGKLIVTTGLTIAGISGVTFPTNFGVLSISATTGLVDLTQTAADKVWGTATRVLTAGTNIVLAKGTGVTGFNDIAATAIVSGGAITTSGGVASADAVTFAGNVPVQTNGKLWVLDGSGNAVAPASDSSAIKTVTDHLATALELNSGNYRFTVAALANAPSGGGGGGTVTGYASGQDPATLVLDALAASHDGAGTIGQKINAAGGAADPLLNPVPGSYAAGTAGYNLGNIPAIKAKTDLITNGGTIYVTSPVAVSGAVSLIRGDDYKSADGRALTWTGSKANVWPDLTAASVNLIFLQGGSILTPLHAATVVTPTGTQEISAELTHTDTTTLPLGQLAYRLVATLGDGDVVTLVEGGAAVTQ